MSSMHDNDNRIILCDFSTSEFLHHFVREFSCKMMCLNKFMNIINKNISSIFYSPSNLFGFLRNLDYRTFRLSRLFFLLGLFTL